MEAFLNLLPIIFCYFSGILTVWGITICCKDISLLQLFKHKHPRLRKHDRLPSIIIFLATTFILLNLFVFPQYLAYYMEIMFIVEIWYAVFLYLWTSQVLHTQKRAVNPTLAGEAELTNLQN